MNYKQKHLYKKLSIIFISLAYMFVTLYASSFIFIIFNTDKFNNTNKLHWIYILVLTMSLGILFAILCSYYSNKRYNLFNKIREYRKRVLFHKVITLLMNGQISEGANIYNTQVPKGIYEDFLYPFVINSLLHSTDKTELEKGNRLINSILNDYNPNDIKF